MNQRSNQKTPGDMSPTAIQFEALVRRLLVARQFVIRDPSDAALDKGFDFIATLRDEAWAIEVKFYRTARPQVALLESAASRLTARAPRYVAKKGLLVVSCLVPGDLRLALEERFRLTIVDRSDLLIWADGAPELLDELSAILEVDPTGADRPAASARVLEIDGPYLPPNPPAEDKKGTDLCLKLRGIKGGKRNWQAFEALGDEILRYLFPKDLHGWHKQRATDDGLSRYDYVCRIRPTTEFWQFIVQHLNSRYMVFEFKNYSEKIKQGQILTTEKYLLERGLRRVAIVISRHGASENAQKMAQGAMREHGKLILVLSDEEVCKMLHMKERGEDPSDFLFETTDQFLTSLPR